MMAWSFIGAMALGFVLTIIAAVIVAQSDDDDDWSNWA